MIAKDEFFEFFDNRSEVLRKIADRTNENMMDFAELMALRAKELAPRWPSKPPPPSTGHLRSSIDVGVEGTYRFGLKIFAVKAEAAYAAFQELGTSKMAAQPFMAPAYRETKKNFDRDAKQWQR